jgi:hypothetical protein
MDVGIGLPNAVPDTEGRTLVDWARRADEAGFSTLGTTGRLVYPNYEKLIALAVGAAVTSRIRLTTSACWRRCTRTRRCSPSRRPRSTASRVAAWCWVWASAAGRTTSL